MYDKETLEEIGELLHNNSQEVRKLTDDFLNLLFWKDYTGGYVSYKDRAKIFDEIRGARKMNIYDGDTFVSLDTKKILPFINELRSAIGLPELTCEYMAGNIFEITPEIRKKLMLKELDKNGSKQ